MWSNVAPRTYLKKTHFQNRLDCIACSNKRINLGSTINVIGGGRGAFMTHLRAQILNKIIIRVPNITRKTDCGLALNMLIAPTYHILHI